MDRHILTVIQPAREAHAGLFTDLSIYPYSGTSSDLSKIPPILGESLFTVPEKNDQYKKVEDWPKYENTFCDFFLRICAILLYLFLAKNIIFPSRTVFDKN